MNPDRPIEERITRWLEEEAPGDLPHMVIESAFEEARSLPQDRPVVGRWSIGGIVPSRRAALLLAAALAAAITGGILVGSQISRPRPTTEAPRNLLSDIRAAGQIRIAVRPDHPQAAIGSVASGFDADIAAELARRLGVRDDVVFVDGPTMLGADQHTWDAALPSTADWIINAGGFERTSPYYYWTHRLVVGAASTAASIQDVAAGPICAVADDASMSWLVGGYGAAASTAATTSVITRPTDADCLAALTTGDAVAFLTARLSDAELQVLADIRVIGGPDAEPRSVLVRRQTGSEADPADLLAALDGALAAMRADGTLTRLSQSRFGGADLTRP